MERHTEKGFEKEILLKEWALRRLIQLPILITWSIP